MGYFQLANRRGWWDFETGLYDGYRDVQGQVIDPQTHKWIPQTYVELQAELADTTPQSRQTARALADAVRRMMDLEKQGKSLPAEAPVGWPSLLTANKFRKANVTAELELTELAVRLSPGDRLAWEPLPELAAAGKLTPAMKKYWGNVLQSVCGVKYLDFVVAVLIPMVRSESDVQEQERLWNWLFGVVVSRPGLAVRVRMEQAAMWEARGLAERAGQCYVDVIERYATAGPFVIDALQKEEKILRASGKPDRVLALYDTTWMRLKPPVQGRWMGKQSNWYRVGMLLADQLDQATRIQQAASLRTILAQQLQQD